MPSIVSFDRAKVLYIFYLVAMHQTLLAARSQAVHLLAYPTVHCGTETMMGLLLISGWVASMTWKDGTWKDYMKKKALRLLPAYYIAVIITLVPVMMENSGPAEISEYALEVLTLGAWNPRLMWVSKNRPLWFMSVLLLFHYTAPFFLPLIRKAGARSLLALFIALYLVRLGASALTLLVLGRTYHGLHGLDRAVHMWMPTQMLLPFMGSVLQQFVARLDIPKWVRRIHVRLLADASLLILCSLSLFMPTTGNVIIDGLIKYTNLLNGPALVVSVALISVDCNSLVWITSAWPELARLFDSMLSLSYVLFLTHWPLALVLKHAQLFSADSLTSLVGTYCSSIIFAILMKALVIDPFGRWVHAWLHDVSPPAEQRLLTCASDPPEQRAFNPEKERVSSYGS